MSPTRPPGTNTTTISRNVPRIVSSIPGWSTRGGLHDCGQRGADQQPNGAEAANDEHHHVDAPASARMADGEMLWLKLMYQAPAIPARNPEIANAMTR